MPKLFTALPKNTGLICPRGIFERRGGSVHAVNQVHIGAQLFGKVVTNAAVYFRVATFDG